MTDDSIIGKCGKLIYNHVLSTYKTLIAYIEKKFFDKNVNFTYNQSTLVHQCQVFLITMVSEMRRIINTEKSGNNMENNKHKKIFISHASEDAAYVQKIIELFEDIGLTENDVVCTSVPGYGIPVGENIYDWLAMQFRNFDLHVLFILSNHYYNSVACQNEMGAAWVLKAKYNTILLPGFEYNDIQGAIDPRQISIKLDGDAAVLRQHLNELKDVLITDFNLTCPSDSKWKRNRSTFIEAISSIHPEGMSSTAEECVRLTADAEELLMYAAKDPNGQVQAVKVLRGTSIITNSRPFCSPSAGPRVEAKWKGALEELERQNLLEATSHKREIFSVTREGYDYADELTEQKGVQIPTVDQNIENFL